MDLSQPSKKTIGNLQKLVGGQISSIFVEGGRIEKGENIIFHGFGMISIITKKGDSTFKWRFKFDKKIENGFYSEFYEWDKDMLFTKRYNPKTSEVNYDYDHSENSKKYPLSFEIHSQPNEDYKLARKIKSIKLFHYVGSFKNHLDTECKHDYFGFIDIETETGRRVIIIPDDSINCFDIHFDHLDLINYRLAEIHDDPGETFGQKRYQLKLELN